MHCCLVLFFFLLDVLSLFFLLFFLYLFDGFTCRLGYRNLSLSLSLTRLFHRIAHLLFYSVDCCQRSYEQMLLLECNVSLHRFCRNSIPRILSCYYYYYYFRSFDGVVFVSDVYTTNVHVVLSFSSPIETVNTKSNKDDNET